VAFVEADECVDWLEYLKDGQIKTDDALLQEARELARILAKAVRTTRANNVRDSGPPNRDRPAEL
jgi:hypothetical protein